VARERRGRHAAAEREIKEGNKGKKERN